MLSFCYKASLHWLDLRVFYVRVSKCMVDDDSMPEYLRLNHVPLNHDSLLEVNCAKASIYLDGLSILLKRDRLDMQFEEVTFVNTDIIRMTEVSFSGLSWRYDGSVRNLGIVL